MEQKSGVGINRLRQHFSIRVINEARYLVEFWWNVQRNGWTAGDAELMSQAAERLRKHALRYQQPVHVGLAEEMLRLLIRMQATGGALTSPSIESLHELISSLAEARLQAQQSETVGGAQVMRERKPLYLALNDRERAQHLAEQLQYYGVMAEVVEDAAAFRQLLGVRYPLALIADVDFAGEGQGLLLARRMQAGMETPVPVIFLSRGPVDLMVRLAAVRSGGEAFLQGDVDASAVLEAVENLGQNNNGAPFRVLLVDDSRAQALLTERTLNAAVILTRVVNNPTHALRELEDFNPDLIMLDMYMPECSGPELARMIRQCERFDSVPIIYLSGEDNLEKQLQAMRHGADDFLTKPVAAAHLVATVRNRLFRSRSLKARMVRDSLTGLYNHTYILQLLEEACVQSQRSGRPLSVVMVDIDHFKQINDSYGHPMGDRVIKSLALLLKQRLRKTDMIGRYGGEEFLLVLPGADQEQAIKVADELRERFVQMTFQAAGQAFSSSLSAGVTACQPDLGSCMDWVSLADEALYRAKQQGRNRVLGQPQGGH